MSQRESMEYDVVIVGAASPAWPPPSAEATRRGEGPRISVCVLEKGSEVGAHILSGA
jgi:electron-transferring-flavoprotein dehydrogenase